MDRTATFWWLKQLRIFGALTVLLGSLVVLPELAHCHGDDSPAEQAAHGHVAHTHGEHRHPEADGNTHDRQAHAHRTVHRHDGSELLDHSHDEDIETHDAAVATAGFTPAHPVFSLSTSFAFVVLATSTVHPTSPQARGPPPPRPWQIYKSTIVLTV